MSITSSTTNRITPLQWLSLATLLAVALAVRLYRIDSESIWYDESVTYMSLDRAGPMEYFRAEAENDPLAVPAYFGSAYVWHKLGFTSVVAMRMLSVLPACWALRSSISLGGGCSGTWAE